MDSVFITTRKQRIIRELRDYMLIALGMLMYAIGWTVFLLPNAFLRVRCQVLLLLFIGLPVCRFSTPIWE